jgi:uncharacterized membrane protein YphA (DoxX/SURF4 family)
MTTNSPTTLNGSSHSVGSLDAGTGLAIVRLIIGAEFVSVFFENLGKGLYRPPVYAGLIQSYIGKGTAPAIWKSVETMVANHASIAAPLQAMTEISFGVLLVLGLFTRPVAFLAFLYLGSLWLSELGIGWIWELLVPVVALLGLAIGGAGRKWGIDSIFARRHPNSLWW